MARVFVSAAFAAVLWASAAQAQTTPETPETLRQVYACADISEDAARLACYDQSIGRLRAAESEGQVVAVDRAQMQTIERDAFGFSLPSIANILTRRGNNDGDADRDIVERIEMEVARVASRLDGRHSFVMTNGQSWIQIQPNSASNVRPGDTITIRRAALGSYMLSPERGAAHRVRREE